MTRSQWPVNRVDLRDGPAHRSKVTKGPGFRAAGLAMAFKLIESAQDRWRCVNAPHLVALVRAGATFINGKLVERLHVGENCADTYLPTIFTGMIGAGCRDIL